MVLREEGWRLGHWVVHLARVASDVGAVAVPSYVVRAALVCAGIAVRILRFSNISSALSIVIHISHRATSASVLSCASGHLHLRKLGHLIIVSRSVGSFHCSDTGEGPAGSTLPLVLDSRDKMDLPVAGRGLETGVIRSWDGLLLSLQEPFLHHVLRNQNVLVLLRVPVSEVGWSDLVQVLRVSVVLLPLLIVILEAHQAVEFLIRVSVLAVEVNLELQEVVVDRRVHVLYISLQG